MYQQNAPVSNFFTSNPEDSSEHDLMSPLLPPPNPLLPKTMKVLDKPPESSIKGITFRKLKEFKQFAG